MSKPKTIDAALAAVRAAKDKKLKSKALEQLAALAYQSPDVVKTFNAVAALPDGHAAAVELAARMPVPLPPGVVLLAAPVLAEKGVPLSMRLTVAGKLIGTLPDRADAIGPVLRSVTAGCGPTRSLERLIKVQSRVGKCDALDKIVADTEAKVRYRCPKCRSRHTRSGLAKHLWKKHRTLWDGGAVREAGPHVEAAVGDAAKTGEAAGLDRVYLWADALYKGVKPAQVHQAILSRLGAYPDEIEPLKRSAREQGAGVCPGCFASVLAPCPPMPSPLVVSSGRVAGDGYLAEVRQIAGARTVRVTGPTGEVLASGGDGGPRLSARSLAVWLLIPIAVMTVLAAMIVPMTVAKPLAVVFLLTFAGVAAYGAALAIKKPLPKPTDRAVDAAWREIAPHVGRSPAAVRFLIRLCRTSVGRGTSADRTEVVWELADHAEVLADKGGVYLQLLAAVRVLQAWDSAQLGKDFVSQLVPVFDPFVKGDFHPGYADAVAEVLLTADAVTDRDTARLRVLLVVAAADAGLTVANFTSLFDAAPSFGRLIGGPPEWLKLLFATYRVRHVRPWEEFGESEAVWDFARKSPTASGRVLAANPDTLLICRFDKLVDDELGAVLIGRKGVTVAGATVADPAAEVAVEANRGGGLLEFGTHRIATRRRLPERVAITLRAWVKFRGEKLLPLADRPDGAGAADRVVEITRRAAVDCPLCGTRAIIRVGEVGKRVEGA